MQIIAGALGGRRFKTPKGDKTHPMADRVRGALFNILGDIHGLKIMDSFAGSGTLSLEAISRGAASSVALERAQKPFLLLKENIENLGLKGRITPIRTNCASWSDKNHEAKFDIILCDPPFTDTQLSTVERLVRHLKSTGTMVICYSGRESTPNVNGVVVVDNRSYGDAALAFYRKVEQPV